MHLLEVQVLEGGRGLLPLLAVGAALVRGALQVVLVVHPERAREHVVHDHHADVHPAAVDVVQAVELGQQRPGVLVQVLQRSGRTHALG